MEELPGYSKYRFLGNGNVFNVGRGEWLKGSVNPDGYVHYRLTDDDGVVKTIGRHRLVALLHHGIPSDPKAIVNHLNGVKGDDVHTNLEWTTYRGNSEHAGAMGLSEKCYPVTIRNVETGELTHFPSAARLAENVGLTKDAVLWRLKHGEHRVYPEGYQYRRRDDGRPWSDSLERRYGRKRSVLVKDLRDGSVLTFDRQTDAAKFLEVSDATVSTAITDNDQPVFDGRYQLKIGDSEVEWRIIENPLLENCRGRPVIAIDPSGNSFIYATARECAAAMALKPTTLNERLKSNGEKIFKDGFRYRYY